MLMENEFLCFVKYIGLDTEGLNVYELLFTDDLDSVWGENFEYTPMGLMNNLVPYDNCYNLTVQIKTEMFFKVIQDSACNSFQDCADGCVALAYEDLTNYTEYPEEGRIVLPFGVPYEKVESLLSKKNVILNEKEDD